MAGWKDNLKVGATPIVFEDRGGGGSATRSTSSKSSKSPTPTKEEASKKTAEQDALAVYQDKISVYLKENAAEWQQKLDNKHVVEVTPTYQLPTFDPSQPRNGDSKTRSRFDQIMNGATTAPQGITTASLVEAGNLSVNSPPQDLVNKIIQLEDELQQRDMDVENLLAENKHLREMLEVAKQHGQLPGMVSDHGSDQSSPGAQERKWREEAAEAARRDQAQYDAEVRRVQQEYETKMAELSIKAPSRPTPPYRYGSPKGSPTSGSLPPSQPRVGPRLFPQRQIPLARQFPDVPTRQQMQMQIPGPIQGTYDQPGQAGAPQWPE
ncbi:hypothetical protein T439DRAFT_360319 [Meredithblackwellia eburnea MCA 4105]